ncbi:MAG: transposase [Syntrophobacteraceae bacterium]
MTNYRRSRLPGATYFFTVTIAQRHLDLLVRYVQDLKAAFRDEHQRAPFVNVALVILPEHLHAIWRLPNGDSDYSQRRRRIKAGFSHALPLGERVNSSCKMKGERGVWQRRFWEHTIRDEDDLKNHLDYIHYNPVKHGLVQRVSEWPHSTFHHYVQRGIYTVDWGGFKAGLDGDFGE